jgi:4-amino-4-deoxy-L-arabinose transferase-like glycosyltransferase
MPGTPNGHQIAERAAPPRGRPQFGLWAVLLAFLVASAAANPLRECPLSDDWAFAATVWNWLDTGQYRLNEWIAANPPFQIAWGALFCRLFGESFAVLRMSTIGLALVGLAAFRGLALEHGLSRRAADLLTLCVASSSLVFRMSLTFMSDVPFFAALTVAIWCYTRAVRRGTLLSWTLAAGSGATAILVRQFGVALVPALAVVWFIDPARKRRCAGYALGLSVPVLAAAWQFYEGWEHPNWGARFLLYREELFLFSRPFFVQLPWRVVVVCGYLALWLVPIVLVAAADACREMRTKTNASPASNHRLKPVLSLVFWCVLVVGTVIYGLDFIGWSYSAKFGGSAALMPWISHSYDNLGSLPEPIRWGLTVFVIMGAALFGRIFAARYVGPRRRPLSPAELVLDLTTLFSLVVTLGFNQFNDRYFLVYLPYAAIIVAKRVEGPLVASPRAVIAGCLLLLAGSAVWTREDMAKDEALWNLSARLHQQGIPPQQIFSDWRWLFYWEFDDFAHSGNITAASTYVDLFGDKWLGRRRAAAPYRVVHDLTSPGGEQWTVIETTRYFSLLSFQWETYYAVRRDRVPSRDL